MNKADGGLLLLQHGSYDPPGYVASDPRGVEYAYEAAGGGEVAQETGGA